MSLKGVYFSISPVKGSHIGNSFEYGNMFPIFFRCSRCRRVDLALNGLRIMLKQRSGANTTNALPRNQQRPLPNEVGAWTGESLIYFASAIPPIPLEFLVC